MRSKLQKTENYEQNQAEIEARFNRRLALYKQQNEGVEEKKKFVKDFYKDYNITIFPNSFKINPKFGIELSKNVPIDFKPCATDARSFVYELNKPITEQLYEFFKPFQNVNLSLKYAASSLIGTRTCSMLSRSRIVTE